MDISQEWNKGMNTIGTDYNQPKIRLIHIKIIKKIKQIWELKKLYQETHTNPIKQVKKSLIKHPACLGSQVWVYLTNSLVPTTQRLDWENKRIK